MSHFEQVWGFISQPYQNTKAEDRVREELMAGILGVCLFHTFLGARIDPETTCSDASMRGGAIARSDTLTSFGKSFLQSQQPENRPTKVPIVLVSLFNGIGGAFRCMDLVGAQIVGGVSVDIHKPGNRTTQRRWPHIEQWCDIRTFTSEVIEGIFEQFGFFEYIDIWGGFPCVDLSAVKAGRQNLRGTQSSLIFEAIRVINDIQVLFPGKIIRFFIENVASMDVSARDQISSLLGVTPYKIDPRLQVPMARPRFCWTNCEVINMDNVHFVAQSGYTVIEMEGSWPDSKAWLDEESFQYDEQVIYPTCMKAIRRPAPPILPAGLDRCDPETVARWQLDSFKYAPYQYKAQYLIWDEKAQHARLLNSVEREALLGYGKGHTEICLSASEAKQNKQRYEDERCSLLGDSFSIHSFCYFAACAVAKWIPIRDIRQLDNRMGLPPGASLHINVSCPMSSIPSYGCFLSPDWGTASLSAFLALRANHTGSDIRITTGSYMNPKHVQRQSVLSTWWEWAPVFKCLWKTVEHINPLEARAIMLTLFWKARKGTAVNKRIFHLTDSYVCQSIYSKGRTSSKMMQPIIRKSNALLLSSFLYLYLTHVDSMDNPTDEASRS